MIIIVNEACGGAKKYYVLTCNGCAILKRWSPFQFLTCLAAFYVNSRGALI